MGMLAARQLGWLVVALLVAVALILVGSVLFGAPEAHGWLELHRPLD
jgi:hypothetical protein